MENTPPIAQRKSNRILNSVRRECLKCFESGLGYKATAKKMGLNAYTVREYLRRYKQGDLSWAERGAKDPGTTKA